MTSDKNKMKYYSDKISADQISKTINECKYVFANVKYKKWWHK